MGGGLFARGRFEVHPRQTLLRCGLWHTWSLRLRSVGDGVLACRRSAVCHTGVLSDMLVECQRVSVSIDK